eukprot:GFUD01017750.1.p1 GENE.GFUD01017750.1~~GFUD01017750.1.p1  ORF type:complete len:541 (+),score=124.83 GFUD01017750.1:44-1666(+)
MSYLLKREPVWPDPFPLSNTTAVIKLLSGDGCQVAVPAALLLATSPLVRTLLSTDHCPPAYIEPVISLPSVTGDVLQVVGTILATGVARGSQDRQMEVQEVLRMLRIEALLIGLQIQSDNKSNFVLNVKQEYKNVEDVKETVQADEAKLKNLYKEIPASESDVQVGLDLHSDNFVQDVYKKIENADVGKEALKADDANLKNFKQVQVKIEKLKFKSVNSLQNKCSQCENIFSERGSLFRHIRTQHEQPSKFCCDQCPKKYNRNDQLLEHVQSVHEKKIFNCHICDKKFKRPRTVRNHVIAAHQGGSSLVNETFKADGAKLRYLNKETAANESEVQVGLHLQIDNFVQDVNQEIENAFVGKEVVEADDAKLKNLNNVEVKIEKLKIESVYSLQNKCSHCETIFSKRCHLLRHIREQHEPEPSKFCCDQCPKKFNRDYQLLIHVKTHDSAKLDCIQCLIKFNRKDKLLEHKRLIHGDELKFCCVLCPKMYDRRVRLLEHVQVVHEKKIFKCHICDKEFKRPRSVKKHVVAAHQGGSSLLQHL